MHLYSTCIGHGICEDAITACFVTIGPTQGGTACSSAGSTNPTQNTYPCSCTECFHSQVFRAFSSLV